MVWLSDWVLRHRLAVAAAWIAALLAGGWAASGISGRLAKQFAVPGAPSYQANEAILRTFGNGGGGYPDVAIVTLPPAMTVQTAGAAASVRAAFAAVASDRRLRVLSGLDTAAKPQPLISSDRRTVLALVFKPFHGELQTQSFAPEITRAIAARVPRGMTVRVTGIDELSSGGGGSRGFGVLAETLLAGLGALTVLAFVFGSLLAVVPLLLAAVSILTTFLLIDALTVFASVSQIVEYLVALIGLGVAIDYSLLIVTRWREELAHGHDSSHAVQIALATAGRAVAFSAIIVAIGLLALVLLPVPSLRSVGYAGMLVPLVSAAAALTLLPVLLATVGRQADWPRPRRSPAGERAWASWARRVVAHPWPAALTATAILAALASVALQLRVGQPGSASLAQPGAPVQTLRALQRSGLGTGVLTPIEALAPQNVAGTTANHLARVPGVQLAVAPSAPSWRRDGLAAITVVPTRELSSNAGKLTLDRVRASATRERADVRIGGAGAATIDETRLFYERIPLVLAVIALTTFALLARALRSLILPVKAILLNLASVAATYGIIVLVWQQGHGSHAIWGTPATGAITNWVPLMAFAFLYGLSMDYEVFILTRVREQYDRNGSTNEAIIQGIGRTGRLVTSAALILFLAFAALTAAPETDLRIMATALGAGILLDATIVRALLVPALLTLLGRWNWWLPGKPDRREHLGEHSTSKPQQGQATIGQERS